MISPRLILLTSTAPRHRFLADVLSRAFNLCGIVSEEKRAAPAGSEETREPLLREHLMSRDAAEKTFFGLYASFPVAAEHLLSIEAGRASDPDTIAWIGERKPDALVLFGSSIIRDSLLSCFPDRVINLHLGLSPYYRGTATNFWPLVHREPECTGATIHLAVKKVDAGGILAQARPDISADDGCHEIGCKALIAGAHALVSGIRGFLAGRIRSHIQEKGAGKVFTRTDFSLAALQKMKEHFASRMIPEYLADKQARDARFPIITLP